MLFFDYELPPGRVAQRPAKSRDGSRLLVADRRSGRLAHHTFADFGQFLDAGDVLVVNQSRVAPARLLGVRVLTGGRFEALVVGSSGGQFEALAQTRGTVVDGEELRTDTGLVLTLVGRTPEGRWLLRPHAEGSPGELLDQFGLPPLPPYIRKGVPDADDAERYQTVYAADAGSVAAPTAGLHFTPELLAALEAKGVRRAAVTLHVGLGTFAPVKADPRDHVMHPEVCDVPAETVALCRAARAEGRRVVAVGTTTTRALETAAGGPGTGFRGESALYIRPGYEFQLVSDLLTNFHLPRTTLLLLVQALAGTDLTRRAYESAIANDYRFFSYGDAMLVRS